MQKIISGDRFWFSKAETAGFTEAQTNNLKDIRFSSIICANMPFVNKIQPNAFVDADAGLNHPVHCSNLPVLDIDFWYDDNIDENISEDAEVSEAINAAKNRLLEFRRYEYDLFKDNFVTARGTGLSGLGAVNKPSIQVLNAMNTSVLFELVTYEFLRRPKLSLMIYNKATPRRIKRSFGITRPTGILNKVYHVTPINVDFDNKIKTSIENVPQTKIYYKSVSTKRIIDSTSFEEIKDNLGKNIVLMNLSEFKKKLSLFKAFSSENQFRLLNCFSATFDI